MSMNKLMVVAAVAASVMSARADIKTLTWNGADGAAWTTGENWLDGETPSAWVDGANAVFPSAATVALGSAVSVSNLTASGTLTLGCETAASYDSFLTTTSTLVFPGLALSDITGVDAMMGGYNFNSGNSPVPARAYHFSGDANTVTVQFLAAYKTSVRCVKVVFTQGGDGVYARAIYPTGYAEYANNSTSPTYVGCDADLLGMRWTQNVATSPTSVGYGVYGLRASVARLNLSGTAAFGGDLATSNISVSVTAPLEQRWPNKVTMQGGTFSVVGTGVTIDKTFGITDPDVASAAAQWMSTTAGGTVLTNLVLYRTTPVSAIMRGTAIGFNANAKVYHLNFDGEKMTFQLQFHSGGVKGALVELKQSGANVTAQRVRGWWWSNEKGGTADMVGCDLVAKQKELGTSVIQNNTGSYGVKSIVLRTPAWTSLTFGHGGRVDDLIVDGAQVRLESSNSNTAFIRCLSAKNSANVAIGDGTNSSNSGDGCSRRFSSGSSLFCLGGLRTSARAAYVFDDSFVYLPQDHWQQHDGNNYLIDVTLKNGSRCYGFPLRCGYYNPSNIIEVVSAGMTASTNAAGINLCYHNYNGDTAATNTVVLRTDADLAVTGRIYDSPSWPGALVVKRGAATLTLSGNNTFAGRFTVEAGTLALGSNTALPTSAPLTLAGGTVTCGTTTNATGVLTLSGNATIDVGDGTLSFADSRTVTWAVGATLNITGNDRLPTRSIRFGTTADGLTSAQLKQIRYNGSKVSLTSEGYLGGPKGLMIIVR